MNPEVKLKYGRLKGPMQHFSLEREFDLDSMMQSGNFGMTAKIAAHVADMTDNAIVDACIRAAKEEGLTDLYLLDKKFVIDALREKMDREDPKPLTIEDLIKMQDQAVWVQPNGDPLNGCWGVVEGASECEGEKWLYLHGHYGVYRIDEPWVAYRHKPKEGKV